MPGDVGVRCFISFPHMWSSAQVSLKLRTITKFKLQNWTYKQFRLLEKCSFVQFGHMWYFEHLQEVFVEYDGSVIANCVPREPFLINRFVGVLPWVLKPLGEHSQTAWLIVLGKSNRAFNLTLYVSAFVGSRGVVRWVPREVSHPMKMCNFILPDIALFNLFAWSPFGIHHSLRHWYIQKKQ